MPLSCPSCRSRVDEQQIDASGSTVCPDCQTLIRCEWVRGRWKVVSLAKAPRGITVIVDEDPESDGDGYRKANNSPGRFEALHRWRRDPFDYVQMVFCLGMTAMFGSWYPDVLLEPELSFRFFVPAILTGSCLVPVGYILAKWINRNRVSVRDGELRCHSGPIPFPGKRRAHMTLAEVATFEPQAASHRMPDGSAKLWKLVAAFKGGGDELLVSGLSEEQARFLSERLERQLVS